MDPTFKARLDEAVKLKQAKQLNPAWEAFRELARENPASAYFWSNYAHLALLLKRLPEARQFAEHALSLDPHSRFSRLFYAEILIRQNEAGLALAIVRELMDEKPEIPLLKKLLKALKTEEAAALIPSFQEWLRRYPAHPELLSTAAEFYHKAGQTDRAIALYQEMLQKGEASDFAYERLIALKTRGLSSEEKIMQLEAILKLSSRKTNVHLLGLLAQEYKKVGEWDKAEQTYREILKLAPHDLFQKKQLGFLYARKGDLERTIEILSDCLLNDPDDTYVRASLFSAFQKAGAKTAALQLIEQVLARYPDRKSYFGLGKKVKKWPGK